MKTFAEHLHELKIRLMGCLLVLGLGSTLGFMIHKPVEAFLQKPLGQTLYYSNPAGGLSFVMQISLCIGVLFTLPLLLFQLVQFARPAIKPLKTRSVLLVLLTSLLLIVLAIIYAYVVSMPTALQFLTTFNSNNVKALISVSDYVKFLFAYVSGTVIAFQLPLIIFFANKIRRFPPGTLLKYQRPAIVGSIIFAGIITPTVDPINQMMVALPIIVLFEVGALAVMIANKKQKPVATFEIKMPATLTLYEAPPLTLQPVAPALISKPVRTTAHVMPQSLNAELQAEARPRMFMDIMNASAAKTVHG